MSTLTGAAKIQALEEGIKVMMCVTENDGELRKLLTKVKKLSHRYDDEGRLFVGSGVEDGKKGHELRQSKTDNDYCKCPNFAYKQRPGKEDSLCKHLIYAYALDLTIPRTDEL